MSFYRDRARLSNLTCLNEYFFQPLLSAISYNSFNRIEQFSRTEEIYKEASYALISALRFFPIDKPDEWMERFRVMRFLDRVDLYLTLLKSESWLNRWVSVEGFWPSTGPFVAITFHYGAGFWVFKHLKSNLIKITALRRKLKRVDFGDEWVRYNYNVFRNWNLDREMSQKAAIAGDISVRNLIKALENNISIFGLIDVVVPRDKIDCLEVPFMGRIGRFDAGLIRIAKRMGVPIVVYLMRINDDGLSRTLNISNPISSNDEVAAGAQVISILEEAIIRDSTQWHQWGVINSFFKNNINRNFYSFSNNITHSLIN